MAKFDIGTALADVLGSVSKSDAAETLQQIDINLIDSDERNFYSLDGIDDLAANIELCGLQQPIRVRANADMPGRYRIVSGHRRRAALWTLYEESPERWGKVPCIVETDEISPAMEELRLIYANANTRKLTDADLAKQAERVQDLLYQLKEEGVEFPGRMRDHVAAACQVSATKLATLKVIREKLLPPFSDQFASGDLTTQAAYALARLPAEAQLALSDITKGKLLSGYHAEKLLDLVPGYIATTCTCKDGAPCSNFAGRMKATVSTSYSWQMCDGTECCMNCSERFHCSGACKDAKEKSAADKKAEKKKEAKRKAENKANQQKMQKDFFEESVRNAKRLIAAADAAGLDKNEKLCVGWNYQNDTVAEIRNKAAGNFKKDYHFYGDECKAKDLGGMIKNAKLLHCSVDYLLGLTDDLMPAAAQPQGWQTGEPTEPGMYAARFFLDGMPRPVMEFARWDTMLKIWKFKSIESEIEMPCVGWFKIPEV